jgi:hypothetical protein
MSSDKSSGLPQRDVFSMTSSGERIDVKVEVEYEPWEVFRLDIMTFRPMDFIADVVLILQRAIKRDRRRCGLHQRLRMSPRRNQRNF